MAKYCNGNFLVYLSSAGIILGAILAAIADDSVRWVYLLAGAFMGCMEAGFLIQLFIVSQLVN